MKTHTIQTYSITELKEQFPDAYKRAVDHWQNKECYEVGIPWQEEIFDSLKACVERAGLKLKDWNLGICNRSNGIDVGFSQDGAEDLKGARAMAWLENNLFGPLRISFTARDRWKLSAYNRSYLDKALMPYLAGKVPPCPLTGYCADEDYLDALRTSVRKGYTLKEAFEGLADTYVTILEAESEHLRSEAYFVEDAEAREVQFTEDGEEF